jgi:DNA-binding IclR family transcriptional regulator
VSSDEEIPDDVKQAIASLVDSLDFLQVLLLLYRAAGRSFSVAEVAVAVGIPEPGARRELDKMRTRGLAAVDASEHYTFAGTAELTADVARIAAAYGTHRIGLINHVASRALQRIRALADAFRLGKGNKDG